MKNVEAEKASEGREEPSHMFAHNGKWNERKKDKKKVRFADNVKKPMETGMLFAIDSETFHSFTMNMWITNSGASFHITNNDTGLYDITNINKLVQESSGNMPAAKRANSSGWC